MAAGFYGIPRMSADIDVLIEARNRDIPYVVKVLTADFVVDSDVIRDAYAERSMFNLIDLDGHVKVDVIVRDEPLPGVDAFGRAHDFEVDGTTVKMLSPEDLIIAKLLWAKDSRSEMQFRDIHGLVHYRGLDHEYVAAHASRLGVTETLEEASDDRYKT